MILVEEAEKIILSESQDYGIEEVLLEKAMGRILAEDINADRDLPPYDRVTMDGIALNYDAYKRGVRTYNVIGVQAAGDFPIEIKNPNECIEIMTGAALPSSVDTVVRYEDVIIENGTAKIIIDNVRIGQSIHLQGVDKKQQDVIVTADKLVDPVLISVAASAGKSKLFVKKLPTVLIVSTGNELVNVDVIPNPYEIRRSNDFMLNAALKPFHIDADMLHIGDDTELIKDSLKMSLDKYDVIILNGGISMGKFDHIPEVLAELSVQMLFHKVKQRPGKPFWFGKHTRGAKVFAFPGNPVSAFMCFNRYFIPWLNSSLGINDSPINAILNEDIGFDAPLQYFLQVKVKMSNIGELIAIPIEGNGSGDFSNLLLCDAFMELPMERNNFIKGEVYRIWPFTQCFLNNINNS
ncbi:MAG: molybdopterin molybdotransferase MoeA [Bacteroidota bacterium]